VTTIAPGYALTELNAPQLTSICRRLDGLPLAIELAASWVRVLSAQDLLHEVDRSIDLLDAQPAGIEDRHRSMRAVLDSSWRWLGPIEQTAFVRLGVFVGGFTRAAGEQVAGATLATLAVLTERTLIQRLPDRTGGTRYHVHELVRDYALARLEDDHDLAEAVRLNHLRYFLGLVEQAEAVWDTAEEPDILAVLEVDRANIEAALWWALDRDRAIDALQMCAGLFTFWLYTSSRSAYAPLLERALALPWPDESAAGVLARAKVLNVAGYADVLGEDFDLAREHFREALELYQRCGDQVGVAWSLRGTAYVSTVGGNPAAARPLVERSLQICRAIDDQRGLAWSIFDLGQVAFVAGDLAAAKRWLIEAEQIFESRDVPHGVYRVALLLLRIHAARAEREQALAYCEKCLHMQGRGRYIEYGGDLLESIAAQAADLHRGPLAAELFGAGQSWHERYGATRHYFESQFQRDLARARRRLSAEDWSRAYDKGTRLTTAGAQALARQAIDELVKAAKNALSGLTEREVAVLRLVAGGLTDREIADRLVVSPRTVHAHVRSIFDKLGVRTRTAAAREAARLNLT
jgi:non-specific serine/threonine protein kinase